MPKTVMIRLRVELIALEAAHELDLARGRRGLITVRKHRDARLRCIAWLSRSMFVVTVSMNKN
jgi:hypothetical protein